MPNFNKFKEIINKQFDELLNKYLINGHDLIIPSPNQQDFMKILNHFMKILIYHIMNK